MFFAKWRKRHVKLSAQVGIHLYTWTSVCTKPYGHPSLILLHVFRFRLVGLARDLMFLKRSTRVLEFCVCERVGSIHRNDFISRDK